MFYLFVRIRIKSLRLNITCSYFPTGTNTNTNTDNSIQLVTYVMHLRVILHICLRSTKADVDYKIVPVRLRLPCNNRNTVL